MPHASTVFEFINPHVTRSAHGTYPSITMPRTVNGVRPLGGLTFYSTKIAASGYYALGNVSNMIAYVVAGAFMGTCTTQVSIAPNPSDSDWVDIVSSIKVYNGTETTGSAGISGGLSSTGSRPMRTDVVSFFGNYAWVRIKLDIQRGTLHSVNYNF